MLRACRQASNVTTHDLLFSSSVLGESSSSLLLSLLLAQLHLLTSAFPSRRIHTDFDKLTNQTRHLLKLTQDLLVSWTQDFISGSTLNQERKFTLYSDVDNNQIDHLDRTGSALRDGRAAVVPLAKICGREWPYLSSRRGSFSVPHERAQIVAVSLSFSWLVLITRDSRSRRLWVHVGADKA